MKQSVFILMRALLSLLTGVFLSLIELGFFQDAEVLSLPFLAVAALTVPAVFLYLRSRESVLFLLSYALILTFALEGLGRRVVLWHLLACLFVLALLYIQTQLMESAKQAESGVSGASLAFPAALLCCVLAALSTVQIYRLILVPNLPETQKFALLIPPISTEAPTPQGESADTPNVPPPDNHGGLMEGAPGEAQNPPLKLPTQRIRPGMLLMALAAAGLCLLAGAAAFRYLRYRRWMRRIMALPRQEQIVEFYRRCLRCLALCGWARQSHETPLEYLEHAHTGGFLFPPAQFGVVTKAFLASFYGRKDISADWYETCLALFSSAPRLVREKKGKRFYYLHYLRKMY